MILLIAYGNSLRRDDGAGFVLAEMLEEVLLEARIEVRRIECHQLMPELSIDVAAEEVSVVVFLDTRVFGPSDTSQIEAVRVTPPETAFPAMGHNMDAAVILAYAGALTSRPLPPAWLVTVPGMDFDHGEGFSDTTKKVLRNARGRLVDLVGKIAASRT